MNVYRIAKWEYLDDLSGTGARLYGGRWNYEGHNMLYTSSHLSLAVLELLANHVRALVDETYGYVKLEIPEIHQVETLSISSLPSDWRKPSYADATLRRGTDWLKARTSFALQVPSAVLAQEFNVLLNPSHLDFSSIKIIEKDRLDLDGRI